MQVFSLTLLRQSTTLIESSPIIAVGQHHKPAESLQGRCYALDFIKGRNYFPEYYNPVLSFSLPSRIFGFMTLDLLCT
jgi:hypothetical protein